MDTHKGYDITSITETGNKSLIRYRLYTGYYETYVDDSGVETQTFNRKVVNDGSVLFNYYPIQDNDIQETLALLTDEFSTLPMVQGC